ADDKHYWEARHKDEQLSDARVPKVVADWVASRMTAAEKIEPQPEGAKTGEKQESPLQGAAKVRDELLGADASAHPAIVLAGAGIPEEGGVYLLRRDPLTKGKELFQRHCAVCHTHDDLKEKNPTKPTASDLTAFGTKQWILGLLHEPRSDHYFGRTKLKEMAGWVERTRKKAQKDPKELAKLDADFEAVADWLGRH